MPRLPLVDRDDLDESGRRVWDALSETRERLPTSFRSLLTSPGAADGVGRLGAYLRFESGADPRARELAVLVVNRETACRFGWEHHVVLARAMGIDQAVIDDLDAPRQARGLRRIEALAIDLAEETMRDGRATPATFDALVGECGPAEAVDLVIAVGYYTMVAQYFRTLELELELDSLVGLESGADVSAARATRPAHVMKQRPTEST